MDRAQPSNFMKSTLEWMNPYILLSYMVTFLIENILHEFWKEKQTSLWSENKIK